MDRERDRTPRSLLDLAPRRGLWERVLWTTLLVLCVGGTVLWGAWILLRSSDLIMPGVRVLDLDLGGKTRAKAIAMLHRRWQEWSIEAGSEQDQVLSTHPTDLGILFDVKTTVERAYQQHRSLSMFWRGLWGQEEAVQPPVLQVDPEVAAAEIQSWAAVFAVLPVDAGVRVVDGRAQAVPAVNGYVLDVAATASRLERDLVQVVTDRRLQPVLTAVLPAVTDAGKEAARINDWLDNTLSIRAYDPVTDQTLWWTVEPQAWNAWLAWPAAELGQELEWTLVVSPVQAFVSAQAATLAPERYIDLDAAVQAVQEAIASSDWQAALRVYHYPGQHVVGPGETISSIARDYGIPYPWILSANPQVGDDLSVGQTLTIPSPDLLLPLPVVENKRVVVSISQQRVWVYQDGALLWEWPASTGIPSSPTSPGVFQVQLHEENAYAASWNLWMPYFMGIYRPVPDSTFMNGFHGFPTRDGVNLLWTGNLGYPVTYGCILLSTENASTLYAWAEEGVVVEIRP